MKVKASELKLFIAEALRAIISESRLMEKAPPGDEDKVMALKKSLRKQHPEWKEDKVVSVAIATAWKQHNKGKEESVNEAAMPPPVPAAAMAQKKPGTPPPLTPQQQQKAKDQAAMAAYQKAMQAAAQEMGQLSPEEKKAAWDKFIDTIEKQGPQQMKLPPLVEETEEEEVTKVSVSELRTMIRNGLKEAFGLGGDTGPTGGFESEKEEGKAKKSGTFGDGGEKKGPLEEGMKISVKALKEEIYKAIQEMMSAEEGYEAPAMREEVYEEEEAMVSLEEASLWGYRIVDVATKASILVKEESEYPALARSFGWEGNLVSEAVKFLDENVNKQFTDPGYFDRLNEGKKKPSSGLTKKEKSTLVKKAKKGEDIGKKGKGFEKVEKKAKKSGAEDPKAVAAAAMWKARAAKKG